MFIIKQIIIKNRLKKIFGKYPILFAYIFGSAVGGRIGRLSDIDIAVYFDDFVSVAKRFDLKLDLIDELQRIFNKNIDVVLLNDAPPLLVNRILRGGKKIYVKDDKKRVSFETRAFMVFFDWQWRLNKYTNTTYGNR